MSVLVDVHFSQSHKILDHIFDAIASHLSLNALATSGAVQIQVDDSIPWTYLLPSLPILLLVEVAFSMTLH